MCMYGHKCAVCMLHSAHRMAAQCAVVAIPSPRDGHFRYFFIFSITKLIFCNSYQVNLAVSGPFK